MRFIRDRADARFLPSRFHSALFRLGACLVLAATPPQPRPGLALAIDRHQSAAEQYVVASAFFAISVFYIAIGFSHLVNMPLAILIAVVMTPILAHVPMFLAGRVWTVFSSSRVTKNNSRLNSIATFLPLFIASLYFATTRGAARYVAWAVLIVLAAEMLAAAMLWAFRHRVTSLEERFAS